MPHDPIARAHAQLGRVKRQREAGLALLAETLADLDAALSIVCRLPNTPERTALYGVIVRRAEVLRKNAPPVTAPCGAGG